MSARAPAGVKSGLESYTKLPFEKVSADVTVWTPPTRCHVTVSPAVIRIVPGEKPLNHTTPPGASGAPAVHPADIHVVRRRGKTPRDGKEERHEKSDGQNCEHSRPTRSGSIHLLHLLRGITPLGI